MKRKITVPGIDHNRIEDLVTIQTLLADLPREKLLYVTGIAYGLATAERMGKDNRERVC